jgi:hypothetical protein
MDGLDLLPIGNGPTSKPGQEAVCVIAGKNCAFIIDVYTQYANSMERSVRRQLLLVWSRNSTFVTSSQEPVTGACPKPDESSFH